MTNEIENVRKALEESEKKYRTAFEYSGTGMMLIDEDMTVSLMNQRLVDFGGYCREEVEGKRKWFEFIHEDDRPMMLEYARRRDADPDAGAPREYEFRYVHKSGEVRNMLASVGMIPGTRRRLVSLTDITGRKRMEQALEDSERRLRDLFDNANDIIYTHDLDGNLLSVNAAGERVYGYRGTELANINIRDLVDPAYLPVVMERIRKKIDGDEAGALYEILTYTKQRRQVWVEVNTRLITNKDGKQCVEGIARDITQRKQAEKELSESRKQISDVADYMPAIICEADTSLRITWANKQGLTTFGFTEEDVKKGVQILDLVHPDDRERLLHDVDNIMKGDYGNFVEHVFVARDGRLRNLIVNSVPVLKDGGFAGIRSYAVDITEKRKAEQQLRAGEARFRGIFDASPIGIALCDTNGTVAGMNESYRAMFSVPEGAAPSDIRCTLFEILPRAQQQKKRLLSGETIRFESDTDMRFVREKDSVVLTSAGTRYLQWHLTLLRAGGAGDDMVLVQVHDVTEQRRAEDAKLKKAQAEAERAREALDGLRKQLGSTSSFHNMVSRSEQMRRIFDILPEIAQTATTVLITGESGTGKELIARSLHEIGPRKDKPFIAINCSALPDNLLESELFGYKAGAFTDAKKDKPGKFALADGGTIFLDEIGDISPAMQAKMLRVLQQRVIEPLGDTKSVPIDVRVIAATNRDLSAMVKKTEFREDLYYRVKVLNIHLPPLRDRRRDIPALCDHFVGLFNARFKKNIQQVGPAAMHALLGYDYPGNIRELENTIEHAFIFCKSDIIEIEHLPPELSGRTNDAESDDPFAKVTNFDDLERVFIRKMIAEADGNKLKAAQAMGIHKATLFRKIRSLGLDDV